VRLLFSFAGGSGHLEPLVPIARAARAAGHTVAFVGRPWMIPRVEALGFSAFAAGSDAGLTPRRLPLAPIDLNRDRRAVGDHFVLRIGRERAAAIMPLCGRWRPDLLVCEEFDFGAMIAAEALVLPHVTVLIGATGSFVRADVVAEPLNEVRTEHGLPADPGLTMLGGQLVLSPFPPSLRDPGCPLPAGAQAFRLFARDPRSGVAHSSAARGEGRDVRAWLAGRGAVPTVCFTLGTIYNTESGDLFDRVVAGLRDLPIDVVVTVGRDIDPLELGPQPANVRVARFVSHAELLPRCRLVISHGGSGSVLGALAHGLPMVLLPLGADQPLNAARCEALGVAAALDALTVTSQAVGEAAARVLERASYRRNAMLVRGEIAALPGPDHAVALLERLAPPRHDDVTP
jgi:UDP:flavonoid glycosyltransferase YjiC (YdhE family)